MLSIFFFVIRTLYGSLLEQSYFSMSLLIRGKIKNDFYDHMEINY